MTSSLEHSIQVCQIARALEFVPLIDQHGDEIFTVSINMRRRELAQESALTVKSNENKNTSLKRKLVLSNTHAKASTLTRTQEMITLPADYI